MKTLAVYNIKGGVGKTATAVNLGYLAAQSGLRTLLWDLDPQAAASFYFRVKPKVRGVRKLFQRKRALEDAIKATDFEGLDLLPADFAYRHLDLMLDRGGKGSRRLQKLLTPMAADYDLVVLDCQPSISLVSENIFQAADAIVTPTIPTTLSLRTLEQLLDFFTAQRIETPVYAFFSMTDRRKRLHQESMQAPLDTRAQRLAAFVPYLSDIERMGVERAPVAAYAATSLAARAYQGLWRELSRRLGLLADV